MALRKGSTLTKEMFLNQLYGGMVLVTAAGVMLAIALGGSDIFNKL